MALRVLVIPDKFKGTLTAHEAAQAMADGWHAARPADSLVQLPMCDGGDGFGDIMSGLLGAHPVSTPAVDAAHRPCSVVWHFHEPSHTAVIESARVIGLAMLPQGRFHPFELDTFGLGTVLRAAADRGARQCWIGIGGSATNDGGFGMARGLGWQFLDGDGNELAQWTDLSSLARVREPSPSSFEPSVTVAVDVHNPLLGPEGCSRIYGPQKGLGDADLEPAERCLAKLAQCLSAQGYPGHDETPGAGAAGGLGFGLLTFARAKLEPGFDVFAAASELDAHLNEADLVLTGEGALDRQTMMGKGVGQIAKRCRSRKLPCLAFAGAISDPAGARECFEEAHALTPQFATLEEAMSQPSETLRRLVEHAAKARGAAR